MRKPWPGSISSESRSDIFNLRHPAGGAPLIQEKLRGFLRRRFKEKWAQDEYDDRMQFIKSKQETFQFFS